MKIFLYGPGKRYPEVGKGNAMINEKRIAEEFLQLLKIDSLSFREREICDRLKMILGNMGLNAYEDDAGAKIGGNCGNLAAVLRGDSSRIPLLLMAHMDTVAPGRGKKPVFQDGIFRSDGTTVLGGDNIAGIEIILETLRILKEDGIEHGDIWVVFTVAEEEGLLGSRHFDYDGINAQYGIVLDCGGRPGVVALKSAARYDMEINVYGKSAHAGIEPEKGVSAIQIAGKAISLMKLGRIDEETTANIGVITGGTAVNIVCDHVVLKAEVRSISEEKAMIQIKHMKECLNNAACLYGGSVTVDEKLKYHAFNIDENDSIVSLLKTAAAGIGLELQFVATGGGSDANIVNLKHIPTVNLAIGMQNMHRKDESISISDMKRSIEFLVSIIRNAV